jgi:hypothetical protein
MRAATHRTVARCHRLDARKTADLVRCNLLPACYVAPVEILELRRLLPYRNVVVAQAERMKNKTSGLLMEVGALYNKQRLHGKQYFSELLDQLESRRDGRDRPEGWSKAGSGLVRPCFVRLRFRNSKSAVIAGSVSALGSATYDSLSAHILHYEGI